MTSILEYNQEEEERKLGVAERQVGYDEGFKEGRKKEQYNMIKSFMARKGVALEEACDAMGLSLEEYREAERIFKERNK